jgi:hypothetical protein
MSFGSRQEGEGYFLAEEGFTIEGDASQDIPGIKSSMSTEAECLGSTKHAWGVANCPLCLVHQTSRMRSGI